MRWLIIYGTGHGQTTKIARRIERYLRSFGDEVDSYNAASLPKNMAMIQYGAVIVGASVHSGKFQRAVRQFVNEHLAELRRVSSAFFSVSLFEAHLDPQQHARSQTAIDAFLDETGWQPDTVASFAGAIPRTPGGSWFMRRVVWRGLQRDGIATETASYEYTNWDAVEWFTRECAMHARAVHHAYTDGFDQVVPV